VDYFEVGADGGGAFQGGDGWAAGGEVGGQYVQGFDDVGAAGCDGFLLLVAGSLVGD
jgi:hypothetical protein